MTDLLLKSQFVFFKFSNSPFLAHFHESSILESKKKNDFLVYFEMFCIPFFIESTRFSRNISLLLVYPNKKIGHNNKKCDFFELFEKWIWKNWKTALDWGIALFIAVCKPGTALIESALTGESLYFRYWFDFGICSLVFCPNFVIIENQCKLRMGFFKWWTKHQGASILIQATWPLVNQMVQAFYCLKCQ